MVVRVIKPGQIPEEVVVYNVTCSNCTTKFEFMQKDAEYHPEQPEDGRNYAYLSIKCPTCHQRCIAQAMSLQEYMRRK
jgi:DNA-directed RNA polymerase subunit RPC12/RpoP